jgi:hypothetical protein
MEKIPDIHGKRWLIVFLIYADFTTSDDLPKIKKLKTMLNDLLGEIINAVIDPDRSRILVALNNIRFIGDDHAGEKILNETKLYGINADDTGNVIDSCKVISNEDQDGKVLQNPKILDKLFSEINLHPDEELLLMTWDHGSSFGIFRREPTSVNVSRTRMRADQNLHQYPYLDFFLAYALNNNAPEITQENSAQGIIPVQVGRYLLKIRNTSSNVAKLELFDKKGINGQYHENTGKITAVISPDAALALPVTADTSMAVLQNAENHETENTGIDALPLIPEILKNSELNGTLKTWLKERKVGVLLMFNCWMMNMHSMFAFQDSVQCFVAPQGNIDLPGYNINAILREINDANNERLSASELASLCVTTVDDAYSQAKAIVLCPDDPDVTERFKIFAVDLGKMTDTKSNFSLQIRLFRDLLIVLNNKLTANQAQGGELKYFFKYIRSACFDFSGGFTMTVDIVNWILSIKATDRRQPRRFLNLTNDLILPMNNFLQAVNDIQASIVINCSSGKKVYEKERKSAPDIASIQLPPSGYSIFFPIADHSELLNLRDNILSDDLIKQLPEWRTFLGLIEPRATTIFEIP